MKKYSLKDVFKNIYLYFTVAIVIVFIMAALMLNLKVSEKKVDILSSQKKLAYEISHPKTSDMEIAIVKFNGKKAQMYDKIEKLRELQQYDFLGHFAFKNDSECKLQVERLNSVIKNFGDIAKEFYAKNTKANQDEMLKAYQNISLVANEIIIQNMQYDTAIRHFIEKIILLLLLVLVFGFFYTKSKLKSVYEDILHIYGVKEKKKGYVIASQEIDAIALRMKKRPSAHDDPNMIDPLTKINNIKGLFYEYEHKITFKDNHFTCVTIFEVDNFSKANRAFPQEFAQAILKKIAFSISLNKQANDIIARTDYNQFTLVFSRASKEQLFKDVDIIRESIAEINFITKNREVVKITLSGGFVIKTNNTSLEDSIRQAKEILSFAKRNGPNKLAQIKDIADSKI